MNCADNLRASVPWWVKIALKIVLARTPVSYRSWARLGIFKHGAMTDPTYALSIFHKHYDRSEFSRKGNGFVCLELGPGDSLYTAPIAHAYGASKVILLDTGRYASDHVDNLKSLSEHLAPREHVRDLSWLDGASSWDKILERCGGRYLTDGIRSLRSLPEGSVDFTFSNAVLEHVRLHEFRELFSELHRVVRPGGVASHTVDLTDHLDGRLNNLRFAESLWEGPLFSNSGFYTNRIRFSEMLEIMIASGFRVEYVEPKVWPRLPTSRASLNEKFASLSEQDLITFGFEVVLRAD